MLISFSVLIFLAADDLHKSLNNSSWHTEGPHKTETQKAVFKHEIHSFTFSIIIHIMQRL